MANTRTPSNIAPAGAGPEQNAVGAGLELDAFQNFPYGMIIVDREGRLVSANIQGRRLIEAKGLGIDGVSCCELLGCRMPGTTLAKSCLTEMVLEDSKAVPEIRLELSMSDGSTTALWMFAAPLGEDCSHVVLQLRPAPVHDRRRRSNPHWSTGPSLRISILGATVVESNEGPLEGKWLDQRTGQLLKYLLAERHRFVHADEIGENIWPNADFAIATSVRYYIHALRRRIEPERAKREPSAFILSRAGSYRLNLDRVKVDVDDFELHVSNGLALADTDSKAAAEELETGLALYRGEFLSELPFADWAIPERHRLHDLACMGLRCLADIRLDLHMAVRATRTLERLATMVPYDDAIHRQLMELEIALGRRSDAIRRYNALRARIRRTFGHDLDFTLADLKPPAR